MPVLKRPRRLIALTGIAFVLIVAAPTAHLLLRPRQTRHVAVPAPDATPEQVVTAFVDALNAHDCQTAEALMTTGSKTEARAWCEDVASLMDVDVRDHLTEDPQATGHSSAEEVANVPVTFNLNWRPFHNDGSMDPGATRWGYLLVRDSAHAPWRIFDQGVG